MTLLKALLVLAFAVFAAVWAPASASAEAVRYTPQAFADAQAADRLIVLHFNAFWCPTCGVQRPALQDVLDQVAQTPQLQGLIVFTVNFDTQTETVKRFNVQAQSTLIIFKGKTEVGRLTGETDPSVIKALLIKAQTSTPEQLQAALIKASVLSVGSYFLGAVAGVLSILSPCVLPLIPLVVGDAAAAHQFGVLALASGVAVSYVAIGLFVATIGLSIGLDVQTFRIAGAVLMALAGILLLSEPLQERFELAGGRLATAANGLMTRMTPAGLGGQFLFGILLGAVWSPCVGPTLAAAVTLAAQRVALGQVGLVMLAFGLGAAIPLGIIGALSRQALARWRGRLGEVGRAGKAIFAVLMIAIGGLIVTGFDRDAETYLLQISPQWLTNISIGV